MALSFEYVSGAGSEFATSGVFIPISDLPGVSAGEFDIEATTAEKEAKSLLALLNAMQLYLSITPNVIGISESKNSPSSNGADILTLNFTAEWQKLANLSANSITVIPAATTGANAGAAELAIKAVFPSAVYVNGGDTSTTEGIVIEHAAMVAYGLSAPPSVTAGADNRAWFSALLEMMTNATLRDPDNGVESAVITAASGGMGALAIPPSYYAESDPLTDIQSADLQQRGIVARSFAFSVQVELNQANQTFEVRVA
ncbi:MAG: hypothetical protein F6J97_13110 [Leptolyngbya sp. SIO4C1]|nr:hypothetical protein [Leptolyngbya sp. SIO4C1]